MVTSCEKDISIDLPRPETKLVVDGFIEIDEYPIVFLTKNLAYFDAIDTNYVDNLIIKDNQATVIVSYNSQVDTLKPADFPRWPYKGYKGTKFKGQIGGEYNLKIIYDNNEFASHTTIRNPITIDSVKYEHLLNRDTIGTLTAYCTNPPGYGDYFTVTIKTNQQKWYYRSYMVHLLDDKLLETNEVIDIPMLTKAYERNSFFPANSDDYDFLDIIAFKKNDTVSLKLSTINESSYLYWSSWYRNRSTDGNPFTNPAKVKSNIKGENVTGSWIGYGSSMRNIFIDDNYSIVYLD